MELHEAVESQREALLRSLAESIRIPSVQGPAEEGCPYGREVRRCLDHALATAESLGFPTVNLDGQAGWCEYGQGREMVAVLGHLDVVPAGDGWSGDPFSGEVRDGRVFGRGAMDDKGPSFAALYALKAVKDAGVPLGRRIRVLLGANEETGSNDMKYYLAHGGETPVMGFTPDGEYPLINGEKGIVNAVFQRRLRQSGAVRLRKLTGGVAPNVVPDHAEAELLCPPETAAEIAGALPEKVTAVPLPDGVRLTALGVNAHGSTPEQGENAVGRLLLALDRLALEGELREAVHFLAERIGMETDGRSLGIALEDEISGGLTFNLGTAEGDAERLSLCINYRFPVTKQLEDCGPRLQSAMAEGGFTLERQTCKDSLYVSPDSELVTKLLGVYAGETGLPAAPKCIGGGTYAKAVPNIVAFGPIFPGDEVREHKPDEFMEVDRLMKNAHIIAQAMVALAN